MDAEKLIRIAKGEELADVVIKNANLVNVFNDEIKKTDIAIYKGRIAGLGLGYKGQKEIDVNGSYVTPSFIDGHVHIESSMCTPKEFAKAVVPEGTVTVMADPHEISNVFGLHGISYMRAACMNLPLQVYIMLPSCVPATDSETSGFELASYDLSLLMDDPAILGVAEMMNFPGVLSCDKEVMSKLKLGLAKRKKIDGHAPGLSGKNLCAYVAAGVMSDHECTTPEEATEKLGLGMYIMIREGSAAKDLQPLIPVLKGKNTRRCIFVTDDRHPTDLKGHINDMVRQAVEAGVDPITAIKVASINTAEYFGLTDLGAIAPGYRANMLVFDNLKDFKPKLVFKGGEIVAENGKLIVDLEHNEMPKLRGSVNVKWIEAEDFKIPAKSDTVTAMQIVPGTLLTKSIKAKVKVVDGYAESDVDNDLLKIMVFERHKATGNIGKGFVKGFGLKSGAIASTVAHDSHNMIVVGTNDADMQMAATELVKTQGGKVVVNNGKVVSILPLPIAGLMSDQPFETVLQQCHDLKDGVKQIGCNLEDPFMTMAFLSLSVIPDIKITDKGVFDVNAFKFIDIFDTETATV
ncbi:MAG: adenine deaminase [Candidatus Gastranaerophilales bacterium]|nr:adenine deaminase [Candidatus Gastranaerophilales bacterium]